MLRLDWLQVTGFKSFADNTRIRFNEGISSIIGPNGCGKSNLADALGWVLGTGSAHSLRGEKMEDVIFNGTRKRKPSGFVEATLAFSRSDNLPIVLKQVDISSQVLEITRKFYRSGESIYSINQRRCRLKDIRAVLEEASLGFASYALIAQGKIGWFLRAKPAERRTVIEEAARITGYKSRRRSAELKLELTRQNLLRVNDIVSEIERRLRSLKRQAAKARRYQKVKEEFRLIQRQKLALEAHQLKSRLDLLDKELKQLKSSEEDLAKELARREEAHRNTLEERETLETRLSDLRQSQSETRLEIDRTENSIEYHLQQIKATQKSLKVNASEQQAIAQSLEKVREELTHFQSERTALKDEEKQIKAAIQKQTELVNRHETEMEAAEQRAQELQNQLVHLSAETASLNNLKGQLEQRLKAAHATRERLERERAHHSLKLEEITTSFKEVKHTLERKRAEMTELRERLRAQEEKKQDLQKLSDQATKETSEVHKQLIAQRERLHSLQEIELSHAQYSEGVQKFLKHLNSSQTISTDGTLADFIETNPQYERLVEEFLDEELEYILVDSLQEAVAGISELKTLNTGKCTFLTLTSSNGFEGDNGQDPDPGFSSQPGVHGRLSDLLKMKPEVKEAFHRALPHRAQAIVVSDLDRALELAHSYPESTFITLEGESLTSRGLLSATTTQANKLGLLTLKRQKRELEKRVLQLRSKLEELREKEEQQQQELRQALKLFENSEETLLQLEKELIGLSHQAEQWEREEARQERALKVIEEELNQLDLEQKQQAEKIREVKGELDKKKASQSSDERMLSETRKSLQQLRAEFGRIREQLHSVSSDHKVLDERRSALDRTLERIKEQQAGLQLRRKAIQTTQEQNEQRLKKMTQTLETLKADLEKYGKKAEQLASTLGQQEQEYAQWKENYPQTEKVLVDLRAQKTELQEKRSQVDVERARVETQLHNTSQQCAEQLQMSLDEASAGVDLREICEEEMVQQYGELKERLDQFGPLNMAALQEYQESEERYNFLCSQRQDIEGSIADTTRVIQEINRRSREKFREAFQIINTHLNQLFRKLFGGGECGMRLLDEDDLLESGIDIYAQPPGKKLQNVMLLSGGEEALTVFALLMAIFTYRPTRFCVLDEVDAPLDDTNVTRFASLIREMSEQTQFIVITHNKHTMKTSDAVYGITMEEAGVSQVVSVKF